MMTNNTFADKPPAQASTASKLLDQVRERLRLKHYSIRVELSHPDWIKRSGDFDARRNLCRMASAGLIA